MRREMLKKISHRGVQLNCKRGGFGAQTFILIHNAGGNHLFMDPQFHYLIQRGNVVSIDLRGHGDSDKPNQRYTVKSFAEDILHISQELSISEATLIALNYGAAIAIEMANINAKLISHLILIDPPILIEPWVEQLVKDHIEELKDPHMQNFSENLVESAFMNTSHENKLIAINAFNKTSRQALTSTYENLLEWNKTSPDKIHKCHMPLLNIQSSRPFCREDALRDLCPQLISGKVVNSGPWATLEATDQINAMIDRFLLL